MFAYLTLDDMYDLFELLLLALYAQTDTREDFAEWFVQQVNGKGQATDLREDFAQWLVQKATEKGRVIDLQDVNQDLEDLYTRKFITGQRSSGRAGVSHPRLLARGVRAAADCWPEGFNLA